MGVLATLVPKAQPALAGGLTIGSGSAGASWKWPIGGFVDDNGDPIDLSSVTGVCKIVDSPGGTEVLSLTVAGGLGVVTISATKAATAALFSGTDFAKGRVCNWYLTLDDGTDLVHVWLVDNSQFTIRKGH